MSAPPQLPVSPGPDGVDPRWTVPPELVPDLNKLVIEDDLPVDNRFAEKQHRLLTEPLYTSWPGPGEGRPFEALANVGLFYKLDTPALSPDIMLAMDVQFGPDVSRRENRSYFTWELGKPPDVVIEFVSDRRGDELAYKKNQYAQIGIPFYAVFDPDGWLDGPALRSFHLLAGEYQEQTRHWFPLPRVGIGLALWDGRYERQQARWLRWCDEAGVLIPTGQESTQAERLRAEKAEADLAEERLRREKLEARLRELGIEP